MLNRLNCRQSECTDLFRLHACSHFIYPRSCPMHQVGQLSQPPSQSHCSMSHQTTPSQSVRGSYKDTVCSISQNPKHLLERALETSPYVHVCVLKSRMRRGKATEWTVVGVVAGSTLKKYRLLLGD